MTTAEQTKVYRSQMDPMRVLPCVQLNEEGIATEIKESFNWIFDEDTECGEWINGINLRIVTTEPTKNNSFAIQEIQSRKNKNGEINYFNYPAIFEAISEAYGRGFLSYPRTGTEIIGSAYPLKGGWVEGQYRFVSRHEQFVKYGFTEWQRGWRDNDTFVRPAADNGFAAIQLWMLTTLFSSIDDRDDEYTENTSRLITKARDFFPCGRFVDGLIFRNQRLGTYARIPIVALEFYQLYLKTSQIGENTPRKLRDQLGMRLKKVITELNEGVC